MTGKITLHTETETLFIISPFIGQRMSFFPGGTKHTPYYKSIIQAVIVIVKAKKRSIRDVRGRIRAAQGPINSLIMKKEPQMLQVSLRGLKMKSLKPE